MSWSLIDTPFDSSCSIYPRKDSQPIFSAAEQFRPAVVSGPASIAQQSLTPEVPLILIFLACDALLLPYLQAGTSFQLEVETTQAFSEIVVEDGISSSTAPFNTLPPGVMYSMGVPGLSTSRTQPFEPTLGRPVTATEGVEIPFELSTEEGAISDRITDVSCSHLACMAASQNGYVVSGHGVAVNSPLISAVCSQYWWGSSLAGEPQLPRRLTSGFSSLFIKAVKLRVHVNGPPCTPMFSGVCSGGVVDTGATAVCGAYSRWASLAMVGASRVPLPLPTLQSRVGQAPSHRSPCALRNLLARRSS